MKCKLALIIFSHSFILLVVGSQDGPKEVKQKVKVVFSPDSVTTVEFPMGKFPDLYNDREFNRANPMVVYFHGWQSDTDADSVNSIRSAYLFHSFNVVTVDWSAYAKDIEFRTKVIPQLKIIAETFAELLQQFLNNGYSIKLLHLAGHSLGGQACGKISRELRKISNGKYEIPMIVALDPAGPGFEELPIEDFAAISANDAKFVQVIHTSAYLGMQTQCGSIDFYPNGGNRQPGCAHVLTSSDTCNHSRAWQLYQASLRNPTGFPAVKCASYDDFLRIDGGGNCDKNKTVFMGLTANKK